MIKRLWRNFKYKDMFNQYNVLHTNMMEKYRKTGEYDSLGFKKWVESLSQKEREILLDYMLENMGI